MLSKSEAIGWASNQFRWTKKDVERAFVFDEVTFPVEEAIVMEALIRFAGPELRQRQNLQKAQKAQVTMKKSYIEQIELDHAAQIQEFQDNLKEERSQWLAFIRVIYGVARKLGMKDPFIEHILETYDAA
jgi:hypothetical protein